MADKKRTERQYNGPQKKKRKTIQWPTEKGETDSTMAHRKRRDR